MNAGQPYRPVRARRTSRPATTTITEREPDHVPA